MIRNKSFKNSNLVKNIILLASGTAFAQIISFISTPIITRIYGPEVFGIMGSFMAIVGVFTPIAALTYPIAIVLPKRHKDAIGLVKLSFKTALVMSITFLLILLIFYSPIVKMLNLDNIGLLLYLIPFVIFASGMLQIIENWLIRTKQFGISAKATILQSLISQVSKIGVGLYFPTATILTFITSLSESLKGLLMYYFIRKNNKEKSNGIIKYAFKEKFELKKYAKVYKDFPLFRAPQTIIDATTQSAPILILTSFFGPISAGFYTLARTTLNIPINLVSKAVGDVLYPKIADLFNQGKSISLLVTKSTTILSLIGLVPFSVLFIYGPELFGFVFGSEWEIAGEYARWIGLWTYTSFILQPSLKSLPVINQQSLHLVYTVISLIIRIATLVFGFYIFENDIASVALYAIISGLLNIILIVITIYKCKLEILRKH